MRLLCLLLLCAALLLGATGTMTGMEPPLRVVSGNTICHDIVRRVGGERVAATCLLAPGVDPHAYQPMPQDAMALAAAQVVVVNGLGFEGWFAGLALEARCTARVVVATEGLPTLALAGEDGGSAGAHGPAADPHAWNSPQRGVLYVENIRDGLAAADGAGATDYRRRAAELVAELRAIDREARRAFARIPPARRKLVTNHEALGYFAADYGFEVKAVATTQEDSQPSAATLAALVAYIRAQGVRGVFLESGKSRKLMQQVADEAGVRLSAPLHLDFLGPPDSPAGTYPGMLRTNIATVAAALAE